MVQHSVKERVAKRGKGGRGRRLGIKRQQGVVEGDGGKLANINVKLDAKQTEMTLFFSP